VGCFPVYTTEKGETKEVRVEALRVIVKQEATGVAQYIKKGQLVIVLDGLYPKGISLISNDFETRVTLCRYIGETYLIGGPVYLPPRIEVYEPLDSILDVLKQHWEIDIVTVN